MDRTNEVLKRAEAKLASFQQPQGGAIPPAQKVPAPPMSVQPAAKGLLDFVGQNQPQTYVPFAAGTPTLAGKQFREQQRQFNIGVADDVSKRYGVTVSPRDSYDNVMAQIPKGLKTLDQQQDEWTKEYQTAGLTGIFRGQKTSDQAYRDTQAGYEGRRIDLAEQEAGNKESKITSDDIRNEFMASAKNYQQSGKSVDHFIKEEILPQAEQIMNDGFDMQHVIDLAYDAFTKGQFKTRKSYYDSIKAQMKASDPYGYEETFDNWMKSQQLNFSGQTKGDGIKTGSNQKTAQWAEPIQTAADKHGVPSQILYNMMVAESGGNPNARSHAGATGLMQFMPGTAKGMGIDPTDPMQSIDGAARYLKGLHNQFGDWKLAVAAYNAGPGNVKKYKGVPPFKETQNYVRKVFS